MLLRFERAFLRIETDARARVEERLPQALDAHLRHLDPTARGGVVKVLRLGDVPRVQNRDGEATLSRMVAPVVRVLILHDGTYILRKLIERSGDLNRQ